ncbi:uncharacterized protein LOC135483682 isoform X2 [Lineus longissimus]|uniref:uncharacterized protein LOC135483682 isoform X2 n=1 Tax=Lineus longissimus TaxID=88925 RepID=UPI00315D82CC
MYGRVLMDLDGHLARCHSSVSRRQHDQLPECSQGAATEMLSRSMKCKNVETCEVRGCRSNGLIRTLTRHLKEVHSMSRIEYAAYKIFMTLQIKQSTYGYEHQKRNTKQLDQWERLSGIYPMPVDQQVSSMKPIKSILSDTEKDSSNETEITVRNWLDIAQESYISANVTKEVCPVFGEIGEECIFMVKVESRWGALMDKTDTRIFRGQGVGKQVICYTLHLRKRFCDAIEKQRYVDEFKNSIENNIFIMSFGSSGKQFTYPCSACRYFHKMDRISMLYSWRELETSKLLDAILFFHQ